MDKNKQHLLNQIKDIDGFILPGGEKISDVDLFIIDYCYKNNPPRFELLKDSDREIFYSPKVLTKYCGVGYNVCKRVVEKG